MMAINYLKTKHMASFVDSVQEQWLAGRWDDCTPIAAAVAVHAATSSFHDLQLLYL